ncbi:MAG: DUF2306 domain-containing protein [Anaerolineales bacterium]|nr:DUF2306 domain-containing protein [Anaerolineales bacterium]
MKSQTIKSNSSFLQRLGWGVMTFLAVMLFLLAGRYLTLDPEVFFPEQKLVYMAHSTMLWLHIVGVMVAIIIGPFQFLDGMRKGRLLKFHRWLGRSYLIAILVGGIGGLYMAPLAYGGLTAQFGFTALAIVWLFSAFKAYKHIRNKQIELHREWMTRNYALTFAGVMLRLWLPTFGAIGMDFLIGYIIVAWLCWIPNLIVAEWIIRGRRQKQQGLDMSRVDNPQIA